MTARPPSAERCRYWSGDIANSRGRRKATALMNTKQRQPDELFQTEVLPVWRLFIVSLQKDLTPRAHAYIRPVQRVPTHTRRTVHEQSGRFPGNLRLAQGGPR